jgi:hypothetical protein
MNLFARPLEGAGTMLVINGFAHHAHSAQQLLRTLRVVDPMQVHSQRLHWSVTRCNAAVCRVGGKLPVRIGIAVLARNARTPQLQVPVPRQEAQALQPVEM